MGLVQSSTSRAAKFSGSGNHRKSIRNDRQPVVRSSRRYRSSSTSCNVSRNAKEFSRFWASGGQLAPKLRGNSTSSSIKSTRGKDGWRRKSQCSTEAIFTRKSSQYSHSSGEGNNQEAINCKLKLCDIKRRGYTSQNSTQKLSYDNIHGVQNGDRIKKKRIKKNIIRLCPI
uniref:Reverse transcriptase domain-containing protein n=1 Tax=Strongyloides stercoralis TaxID=6248 RepID=A0A0K0EPR8_STRER